MIKPISGYATWLHGKHPLPAGAVPLAQDDCARLVCLMPNGRWIAWLGSVSTSLPPNIQREVMEVVVAHFGGTAATTAEALGVSVRTVEAWRSGRAELPIKAAYKIAEAMATPAKP